MKQKALTILSPVIPAGVERLDQFLTGLGNHVAEQKVIPFEQLDLLHYAAWIIIRNEEFGPQLVFESNFDGEPEAFLDQLVTHARKGLDQIYQFCPGYPRTAPEDIRKYLLDRADYTDSFYIGCVGLSRNRIRAEEELRRQIAGFLDKIPPGTNDAAATRRRIQDFVCNEPKLQWALTPPEAPPLRQRLPTWARWLILIGAVVALLILLPILLVILLSLSVVLWRKERTDRTRIIPPQSPYLRKLKDREDHRPQNHLATINDLKPGWFRFFLLKAVLAVVKLLARWIEIKGKLSDIPSIHFARWVVIRQGKSRALWRNRRLLFLSNFDGSWEGYLGEFIDLAAIGLTAIWSNVVNFPKTRFLFFQGAQREQEFKAEARNSQVSSLLWYSAYPFLSVTNILNNAEIRKNLWKAMDNKKELEAWLRRF